jgi:hypothetical protein
VTFQITGGTGRVKNASGTLTFTETTVPVLADAFNNPRHRDHLVTQNLSQLSQATLLRAEGHGIRIKFVRMLPPKNVNTAELGATRRTNSRNAGGVVPFSHP